MYIGRDANNISNVEKLDNITFDGGTTYALEKSSVAYTPSSSNCILLSIDGIVQQGNFSVSTSNIVFDWSPTSSNTCDWILHYGTGLITTPADSSVTASKLGSLAVTGAKLNTDVISAQTELAAEPADADEFMVSDGGVLKRIDYSLIKGGGKIGQVIDSGTSPDAVIIGSASFVALTDGVTALAASITPSATSSSVLMMVSIMSYCGAGDGYGVSLRRGGVEFYASASAYEIFNNNASSNYSRSFWMALDTGISTTSATEYTVYVKTDSGNDVTFQRTENESKIILMEVLA